MLLNLSIQELSLPLMIFQRAGLSWLSTWIRPLAAKKKTRKRAGMLKFWEQESNNCSCALKDKGEGSLWNIFQKEMGLKIPEHITQCVCMSGWAFVFAYACRGKHWNEDIDSTEPGNSIHTHQ